MSWSPTDNETFPDIPGIDRVRDALSTVMWPTMVRKQPSGARTSKPQLPLLRTHPQNEESGLPHVGESEEEAARSLFLADEGGVSEAEMAALEAWLDDDVDGPWKPSQSQSNPLNATNANPNPTTTNPTSLPNTNAEGFDDDFADFVSAVAEIAVTPIETSNASSIPQAQPSSSSLLPSPSEVQAASSRIFRPSQPTFDADAVDEREAVNPEAFDLNQILSVLSAMKEEISMIEDIEKRRKAAASAALGLVAGLGLEDGEDDEGSELGELMTTE